MVTEISIRVRPEEEGDEKLKNKKLFEALNTQLREKNLSAKNQSVEFQFVKKSIDARHGQIKLFLKYKAYIGEKIADAKNPQDFNFVHTDGTKKVIIVGSGPAGLFAALKLIEHGITPIIIERGKNTSLRKRDIAAISTKGVVGADSNYCFGEGGAGTFSDGKLYTRSNKRGDISRILNIFNFFGADKKILTDAHPHIGTDKLPKIINSMRDKIIECGGQVLFETKCIDFITEKKDADLTVIGIRAANTQTGQIQEITADSVLLATGHSASDIYTLIAKAAPFALQAKTFAVGVRVEHPRELIDSIQYHGKISGQKRGGLSAAEYRLTAQADGRGVYSFCMCPGGFVVPSSTGPEEIVVNGMSTAARNSLWSNAAIVVETRPEDIEGKFTELAKAAGSEELKGLFFRSALEHETFLNGNGQAAPAQRLTDFLNGKQSADFPRTSYTPGIVSSRLDQWLPKRISSRLKTGFNEFGKSMRGFITDQAILIASETRTSTPVRILRDKDSMECIALKNLYPAGEGSGYSGGIVSSAMDGENAAAAIISRLKQS